MPSLRDLFFPKAAESTTMDTLWRATSFLIGLLVMGVSGSIYMFSVYSGPISDHLGYSATELAFIVTFGQSVYYVAAVPTGMIADVAKIGGGRLACLIGAVFNLLGYLLMRWTYDGTLSNSHYGLFALYYSLAGVGGAAPYAGALAINVKIFPNAVRGFVVGLHVAIYALSSLIFTSINTAFFLGHVDDFLLLLALVVGGVNFLGAILLYDLRRVQTAAPAFVVNDSWGGLEEGGVDDQENGGEDERPQAGEKPNPAQYSESSPLLAAGGGGAGTGGSAGEGASRHGEGEVRQRKRGLAGEGQLTRQPSSAGSSPIGGDVSGIALFKTPDFWLLFAILGLGAGCGLMYINNVGSIVRALAYRLDYTDDETQRIINSHVSTISACNAVARITVGLVSDLLLQRYSVPRPVVLVVASFLALFGQVAVLLVTSLPALYAASVLVGSTYGFVFSLVPTLVGDVFGPRAFGTNLGWVVLSPSIGGPITNLFFGAVYDAHSFELNDEVYCDGVPCFQSAFYLTLGLEVVVCLLTALFARRRYRLDRVSAGF